jgi:hypothetical protein
MECEGSGILRIPILGRSPTSRDVAVIADIGSVIQRVAPAKQVAVGIVNEAGHVTPTLLRGFEPGATSFNYRFDFC